MYMYLYTKMLHSNKKYLWVVSKKRIELLTFLSLCLTQPAQDNLPNLDQVLCVECLYIKAVSEGRIHDSCHITMQIIKAELGLEKFAGHHILDKRVSA